MTTPALCPICDKPLALTQTTTTEILVDALGERHPVQAIIHCENGHRADVSDGVAASTVFRRFVLDQVEFVDPGPSREDTLLAIVKWLRGRPGRGGGQIYRLVKPREKWVISEPRQQGSDPCPEAWAEIMNELEPLDPEGIN